MSWIKRNFQEKLQRACSILLATHLPSHPKICQLIVVDKYLFKRTNKDALFQHSDLFPVDYWRWSCVFNNVFQQVFADYERRSSPAKFYLFKVNNRNTRKRCKICSKSTIKTLERRLWRFSGVFIVAIEHISHLFLLFLLLILNK